MVLLPGEIWIERVQSAEGCTLMATATERVDLAGCAAARKAIPDAINLDDQSKFQKLQKKAPLKKEA